MKSSPFAEYVRHDPGDPFPAHGPDDVKRIVTMLRAMLPDFRIDVEAVVAEGISSSVAIRRPHSRGLHGYGPDGKDDTNVAISDVPLLEWEVAESWAARDGQGYFRQLGHLGAPAVLKP